MGGTCKVLLESESLSGDFETSKGEREEHSKSTGNGADKASSLVLNDQGGERMSVQYDKVATLRAASNHPPIVIQCYPSKSCSTYAEGIPASTLKAQGGVLGGGSETLVIDMWENHPADARISGPLRISPTLNTRITSGGCPPLVRQPKNKQMDMAVRRITPLEAERLQGLPDNWTNYGSDTARYKAIGNGMAQPCADFVLGQIAKVIRNKG